MKFIMVMLLFALAACRSKLEVDDRLGFLIDQMTSREWERSFATESPDWKGESWGMYKARFSIDGNVLRCNTDRLGEIQEVRYDVDSNSARAVLDSGVEVVLTSGQVSLVRRGERSETFSMIVFGDGGE